MLIGCSMSEVCDIDKVAAVLDPPFREVSVAVVVEYVVPLFCYPAPNLDFDWLEISEKILFEEGPLAF